LWLNGTRESRSTAQLHSNIPQVSVVVLLYQSQVSVFVLLY
jgi:hypothetical protein